MRFIIRLEADTYNESEGISKCKLLKKLHKLFKSLKKNHELITYHVYEIFERSQEGGTVLITLGTIKRWVEESGKY